MAEKKGKQKYSEDAVARDEQGHFISKKKDNRENNGRLRPEDRDETTGQFLGKPKDGRGNPHPVNLLERGDLFKDDLGKFRVNEPLLEHLKDIPEEEAGRGRFEPLVEPSKVRAKQKVNKKLIALTRALLLADDETKVAVILENLFRIALVAPDDKIRIMASVEYLKHKLGMANRETEKVQVNIQTNIPTNLSAEEVSKLKQAMQVIEINSGPSETPEERARRLSVRKSTKPDANAKKEEETN